MLTIRDLEAGYGGSRVLSGVSFAVERGSIVALLGRNGAGRSTLLRCLMGLLPAGAGSATWDGVPITGARCGAVARR